MVASVWDVFGGGGARAREVLRDGGDGHELT